MTKVFAWTTHDSRSIHTDRYRSYWNNNQPAPKTKSTKYIKTSITSKTKMKIK